MLDDMYSREPLTPTSPIVYDDEIVLNPFYLSLRKTDDAKLALIERQYEPSTPGSPADDPFFNFELLKKLNKQCDQVAGKQLNHLHSAKLQDKSVTRDKENLNPIPFKRINCTVPTTYDENREMISSSLGCRQMSSPIQILDRRTCRLARSLDHDNQLSRKECIARLLF
jgi:hypothetical protein